MPTQSRGFWACDYCGLSCDTLEEAKEHEASECQQRPPSQRPPSYHDSNNNNNSMAPLNAAVTAEMESYAQQQHQEAPHSGGPPQKMHSIPLMGPHEVANLTMEDSIACQNIELFEATPEHAADDDANRTGGTTVVVGQLGLRCIHCARSPLSTASYSTVFPGSLGSVAASVRMVADQHLSMCGMVPPEIQEACNRAANKRRRDAGEKEGRNDEDDRSRLALLDYCVGLCQQFGVANKQPSKTGIVFSRNEHNMAHAETPGHGRAPPPHPHSADRMGPPISVDRMGYPTPVHTGQMMRPGPGVMGGPMGPGGDPLAPTPLQRRRDRPGEQGGQRQPQPPYSAERGGMESGYPPTPYSQGHAGSDYGGPDPNVQTPAQPNFDGPEGGSYPPSSQGPEGSPPDGYSSQYDLPSNFPFYQESNRTWHCKFCGHLHPQYRDPQSIWSAPSGGPPPGNFIDHHLSMCRSYHQSMPSPPMYQGPPPPYGPPYGMPPQHMPPYGGPPGGWEGHSPPQHSMHPQHLQYPPGAGPPPGDPAYPYAPPSHLEHPSNSRYSENPPPGYPGSRQQPGGPPSGPPGAHSGPPPPGGPDRDRGVPPTKENIGDSLRHSIGYLAAADREYFGRNKVGVLVLEEDHLLLTDYFFFLMKQLRLCRFSEADRKTRGGKREKIKLGYGGLQCIHCADVPNSRKFFWSNVDRLANSFAEIPGHVLKCRRCPQQTKDALLQLKQIHPEQMARLPRGSQKVFFRRMWRRLHDEDPQANAAAMEQEAAKENNEENVAPAIKVETPKVEPSGASEKVPELSPATTQDSGETMVFMQRSSQEAAKALAASSSDFAPPSPSSRILLAIPDDKEWLSDMDCYIRRQLEVFCASEEDVSIAQSDRKYPVHVGQVGIRCIHCSLAKKGPAQGTAVAFPFSISGIYESVREFQRLHLDACENLPANTKTKLASFKGSTSLSSVLRKYYVLAARALGLQDTRDGIRTGGESIPLGSAAAFSFADGASHMPEEMRQGGTAAAAKPPAQAPALSTASKKRKELESPPTSAPPVKKEKLSDHVTAEV